MAVQRVEPGMLVDFMTPAEHTRAMTGFRTQIIDGVVKERLRGVTAVRRGMLNVPTVVTKVCDGPASGFVWSLVSAEQVILPMGQSEDLSVIVSDGSFVNDRQYVSSALVGRVVAQPNNAPVTYGLGAILIDSGENVYAIASASGCGLRLLFVEVPAEMVGKLYL